MSAKDEFTAKMFQEKTFFERTPSAYFLPFASQQFRSTQLAWGTGTMPLL